ncbi:MAG TPA: SDR family oxidoreductase [Blastocatellia bacterium]|nr:SDR family oxidoreductase [Blastocatellia bacterium]
MKILVAGASGRLGSEILDELKERDCCTRALVRHSALRAEADEIVTGDARAAAALRGACDGVDVVISAMGASLRPGLTKDRATYRDVAYAANKNLLDEALRAGVRKFIYVSLFGAERLKGVAYADAHEELVRALRASRIDYTVLRPTGFFYVNGEILKLAQRGVGVVIGDGRARTNPVHERDVARACVEAIETNVRERTVGGPEIFTRREIVELAFKCLGRPPKVMSISPGAMKTLIRPVRWVDERLYEFLTFGLAVTTTDLVAPPSGCRKLAAYFQQMVSRETNDAFAEYCHAKAGDSDIAGTGSN